MVDLSPLRPRRSWPVPPALLLACAAVAGCGAETAPGAAIHQDFPSQVQAVLRRGARIEATEHGFSAILTDGVPARAAGEVALPASADQPVVIAPRRGGRFEVREIGLSGRGRIEERAVSYRGEGRTSYWSVTAGGAEEWLLLEPGAARPGQPAAVWEIAGATPIAHQGAVKIVTEQGERLVTVTAPAAFLADGSSAPVQLAVRGATIELHIDTRGQRALVDPEWTFASSMNMPRFGHRALRLSSGEVLVAGGITDSIPAAIPGWASFSVSASVELYDPMQDQWLGLPWMSLDRAEHAMVTQPGNAPPDGGALVIGGRDDFGNFLYDAELFDGQSWQFVPSMFDARAGCSATRLGDDRVLVAGGYNDGGGSGSALSLLGGAQLGGDGFAYLCSVEVFDPSAGSGTGDWIGTGSLSTCRGNHTETLLPGDRVMVAGGEDDLDALSSVEIWSPITGSWTTVAPMLDARTRHTATRLTNGQVLVVGGHDGFGDLAGAELFDPMTSTWTPVGSLAMGRSQHTAVLLGDGKVLVTGGYNDGTPLATAEVYDPTTKSFFSTVPMLTPRAVASATLLASGDVLVAGGDTGFGSPPITGDVEVFSLTGGTGGPCDVAADCGTGFCVDGVCCDSACDQPCEACTVALRGGGGGLDGTCGFVVKGVDPVDECAAMPAATCGTVGACNGAGACQIHPAGTVCQPAACMGTVAQPQGACDGGGTCVKGGTKDCAPYACVAGACLGNCKVQTDCAATAYCDPVGSCKPKLGDGATAADPVQCLSGFAIDGVCCNEACDQECQTCAKDLGAVANGVCSPTSGVQCNDGSACTKLDVCQAGVCVGMQPVNCPGDTGCTGGLACDPATGQCTVPLAPKNPGDPCEDGDVCTTGETCDAASVCSGSLIECTPNECQSGGECVEGIGCQFDSLADFTECTKDDNPCTGEVCKSGQCVFNNNLDGAPCPGGTCFAGQCLPEGGGPGPGAGGGGGNGGGPATGGSGTGAGGPAGGAGPGAGGATGGSPAAGGDEAAGYSLLGGACAVPAGESSTSGLGAAALALLGLAGLRRRRRE